MIWGILSAISIPKESAPYIPFGIVNITTVYSGVSAPEIDTLITQKIENKIKAVSNVSKIDSVSRNSVSSITVEFEPDHNMIKGVSDIRSKVDEAKPELPSDIESDPSVLEIDSAIEPFFSIILYGPYDVVSLRDYAERLKLFLESVPDVASVSISGGAEREIAVEVDPLKLQSFGLTTNDVVNSIRRSHIDTPVGGFDIDALEYNIRFQGKHRSAEDIKKVHLRNLATGGRVSVVRVEDVANVIEQADEDTDSIRRIGLPKENIFENSTNLQVSKGIGKNIFVVDAAVREKVNEYTTKNFPSDLHITYELEISKIAEDDFAKVFQSGLQAVVIVLIILFIFVGFRAGIIAALIIPLTFLTTIGLLSYMGSTLNFMTNFSMILALGILVDTAVVIVEGIQHHIHKGYKPRQAAMMSLHEFKSPLISGTLTTLAVFIPLFSLPGVLGKYLSFIPITVFLVLTSSLFISLLLITAYGGKFMLSRGQIERRKQRCTRFAEIGHRFREKFTARENTVLQKYGDFVQKILSKRRYRIGIFYGALILFVLSIFIPVKFELFPSGDAFSFSVTLERPEGTLTEETDAHMRPLEEALMKIPEVRHISTTVNGKQASSYVELLPVNERKKLKLRPSKEIVDNIQIDFKKRFADPTGSNVRVANAQNGPPSEFPVAFRVIATESDKIQSAETVAEELTELLRDIPGTFGVKSDIEQIPGEFLYRVNREKALALSLDPDNVANVVRTALKGSTAATITRDGRDIDIVVRYHKKSRDDIREVGNIKILNQNGEYILLKQVVDETLTSSLSSIRRRDTRIAFTVSSLLTENGNAAEISTAFLQELENYPLPDGVEVLNAGENEENAALFAALLRAFVLSVLIMFLILVIQFNSYLQPLIILTTIIFAQIGVSIGLFLTGTPRSLAYILGAISLAGIVVNDAIIMVDQMNKNRDRDKGSSLPLSQSIATAGRSRFIPVILTTLTTSAGILPLVFVDVFWAGLSYTVIFGLMMATLLTLFVTPAMYYQMEREKTLTFVPLLALISLILTLVAPGWIAKIFFLVLTIFFVRVIWKKYQTSKVLV